MSFLQSKIIVINSNHLLFNHEAKTTKSTEKDPDRAQWFQKPGQIIRMSEKIRGVFLSAI